MNLLEIWESIEGKFRIQYCVHDKRECFWDVCLFSDQIEKIHRQIYDFLLNNTIHSLAQMAKTTQKGIDSNAERNQWKIKSKQNERLDDT